MYLQQGEIRNTRRALGRWICSHLIMTAGDGGRRKKRRPDPALPCDAAEPPAIKHPPSPRLLCILSSFHGRDTIPGGYTISNVQNISSVAAEELCHRPPARGPLFPYSLALNFHSLFSYPFLHITSSCSRTEHFPCACRASPYRPRYPQVNLSFFLFFFILHA